MKKITMMFAMTIMASAVLFTACGRQQQSSGASSPGGTTTLKLWGREVVYTTVGDRIPMDTTGAMKADFQSKLKDVFLADLAKIGIKLELELVQPEQAPIALQTLMASGQFNNYDLVTSPNAFGGYETMASTYAEQGRFTAINKLVSQYSSGAAKEYFNSSAGQKMAKLLSLPDGNFYWLSDLKSYYYKDPSNSIGSAMTGRIRKDWLDALGLPMPKTAEDFYNAVIAFRDKDVNKTGVKDEVVSVTLTQFNNGIAQWFGIGCNLSGYIADNINGKAVTPWYQPHIKDYIAFMQRLYNAGALSTNFDANGNVAVNKDKDANMAAYLYGYTSDVYDDGSPKPPAGSPAAYYLSFVAQAYPDTAPLAWRENGTTFDMTKLSAVPSATKNAAALGKLIDYLFSKEYYTLTQYGIENYTFKYNNIGGADRINRPGDANADPSVLFWDRERQSWEWTAWVLPEPRIGEDKYGSYLRHLAYGKQGGYADGWQPKADFYDAVETGKYAYADDIVSTMGYPTAKERDRLAAITPDLKTYSEELLSGLIMGQKSLNNWDSYIADLKRLGLDEYVSICQARLDRAK